MNKNEIIELCKNNTRLPGSLRSDKTLAREFINEIEEQNIEVSNHHIFALCSWIGVSLYSYKSNEEYSEVKSIELIGEEMTFDMHIKNGNSYTANGIICHNTINLPEDVTEEKVAEIYETAWKEGCKGITVYRKNCRTGVLVDKKDEQKKVERKSSIQKTDAPERPKDLPCDVHHIKVKGQEYFVLVGLIGESGDPYEVFAGKNGQIAKSVKGGTLTKMARGKYRATFDDENVFESVAEHCDDMEEAICRLTSTSLRHGADIAFVVHQLEKIPGEDMQSFYKALSRALKKYIVDGTKVTGEVCKECQSTSMIRQEGCVFCKNCGWTKCS